MQLGSHIFISNQKPRHKKAFQFKKKNVHVKTLKELFDDSIFKEPRFFRKHQKIKEKILPEKIDYFASIGSVRRQLKEVNK